MTDTLQPPPSARADQVIDRYRDIPHIDASPPGTSLFRRRIRLVNVDSSYTVGELEDDCHHFRVELRHDRSTIVSAAGQYLRGPWTTCREAGEPLRAIEGRPMRPHASAIGGYADARDNCTHLFDLTGLAMAQALRPADTAETAIALRRVIDISMSRMGDLDRFDRAEGVTTRVMMGRCMTYSPQNVAVALRVKGSARSWEHHGHLMLADMHLREPRP